jgi:excisionase family DNA binding protein
MSANPFETIDARLSSIETMLAEIKSGYAKTDEAHQPEGFMTVQECADFLNLSTTTIYILVHKRKIPFFKPPGSKRLHFSREELTAYVKAGRHKSLSDIKFEADQGPVERKKSITHR